MQASTDKPTVQLLLKTLKQLFLVFSNVGLKRFCNFLVKHVRDYRFCQWEFVQQAQLCNNWQILAAVE